MTDSKELLAQLRERKVQIPAPEIGVFMSRTIADPLCAEAADRIEALEAEVVRLREHLSKAVLSEDIVMQMAGFTDPRNVSCADDELNLFAELIEEAKQIHGDLYEGAALEGQS